MWKNLWLWIRCCWSFPSPCHFIFIYFCCLWALSLLSDNVTSYEDDFDLLLWWRDHKLTFLILSIMARDIISVPVSTLFGVLFQFDRQDNWGAASALVTRGCGDADLHKGLGVRRKKGTTCCWQPRVGRLIPELVPWWRWSYWWCSWYLVRLRLTLESVSLICDCERLVYHLNNGL